MWPSGEEADGTSLCLEIRLHIVGYGSWVGLGVSAPTSTALLE